MASHTPFLDPQRPHLWGGEGSPAPLGSETPNPLRRAEMTAARAAGRGLTAGRKRRLPLPALWPRPFPRPTPLPAWSVNGEVMQSARLLLHAETDASGLSLSTYGNCRTALCLERFLLPPPFPALYCVQAPRPTGGSAPGLALPGPLTQGPSHVVGCTILDAQEKEFPAAPPLPNPQWGCVYQRGPRVPGLPLSWRTGVLSASGSPLLCWEWQR